MKLLLFVSGFLSIFSRPADGRTLSPSILGAEGPPLSSPIHLDIHQRTSGPQPPSTDGIELKAPAPPPDWQNEPQPPASPDPFLLEAFEKSPETFPAVFSQWQQQSDLLRDGRAVQSKRRWPTYDQFLTAAIVTGLNIQRSTYTMFAPTDTYLSKLNVSLPTAALTDRECVQKIVRSHTVLGRVTLSEGMEDVAMSLDDSPIFFNAKEAGGVNVVRANIVTDYGIVHIIDGLMDWSRLMDSCPTLRERLSNSEGHQELNSSPSHSISLRKVSDQDLLTGQQDQSIRNNEIDNLLNNAAAVVIPSPEQADPSLSEANIPLELLFNIDNFAHAVKLTWQTEDNVIAILQDLGASTFLALLERTDLMDILTRQGPWTVFAPDNDAWQSLPKEIFDHIVNDPILLKHMLSYHIVQANATRQQLINDQKLPTLYENRPIHINFYTDGWASWYTASGSEISNLDEIASNGVVHIVKSVLLPPLGDFYSVVKWTPALQGAFAMLESVADPVFTNSSAALTAFLPADSPILDVLILNSSPSVIADILRRHVVRGTWFVSGLIDGDQLFTLDNQILTVRRDANCIGIDGTCIVVRDITLTNGVLHVIDKLM